MSDQSRLSAEDQARVDHYLVSGVNQSERKAFRPWRLLGAIWVVLFAMSVVSYLIARHHGVV